mmetsp:Transcript_6003/g.19361  ORF Transcript_6003/g.19361 Transcript_6003/m.19361 type:complete len:251 (+) Transcript_6003:769-1521(+)
MDRVRQLARERILRHAHAVLLCDVSRERWIEHRGLVVLCAVSRAHCCAVEPRRALVKGFADSPIGPETTRAEPVHSRGLEWVREIVWAAIMVLANAGHLTQTIQAASQGRKRAALAPPAGARSRVLTNIHCHASVVRAATRVKKNVFSILVAKVVVGVLGDVLHADDVLGVVKRDVLVTGPTSRSGCSSCGGSGSGSAGAVACKLGVLAPPALVVPRGLSRLGGKLLPRECADLEQGEEHHFAAEQKVVE